MLLRRLLTALRASGVPASSLSSCGSSARLVASTYAPSLSIPARAIYRGSSYGNPTSASTTGASGVTTSPSSPVRSQGSAPRGPRVELAPPSSMTHEGLAYAPCPICSASYHMSDMLLHLTTAHKHLDPVHAERICRARLNLYRRVIGVPLARLEPGRLAQPPLSPRASGSTAPSAASPLLTVRPSQLLREALEHLPRVTAQGAYQCGWCVQRSHDFPTRDAFLKHVVNDHPELPLDDLEPHIPLPPARRRATLEDNSAAEPAAAVTAEGGWRAQPQALAGAAVFGGTSQQRRASGPTRRLVHRTATVHPSTPAKPGTPQPSDLPARQVGITLPRGLDAAVSAAAAAEVRAANPTVPSTSSAGTVDLDALCFYEAHFPCELCGKAFETELNLLQHLENKHPLGTADVDSDSGDGDAAGGVSAAVSADVAQYQRDEAAAPPGQLYAVCDLCGASKVYTLPSALYAHIRFKHPSEDAAFHVERIIEASREKRPVVCPHCARGFATQEALDGHISDKHGAPTGSGNGTGGDPAAASSPAESSLPAVTVKNRWWCNECEKGFGMAKALHGHMVSKHRMPSQVFPCPACKRVFTDVHSLEEHFSMQHRAMSLKDLGIETHVVCKECSRLFLSQEDLQRHHMRHHARRKGRAAAAASVLQHQRAPSPSPEDSADSGKGPAMAAEGLNTAADTLEAPALPRKVPRRRPLASPSSPSPLADSQ